uniref:Putative adenosine transporter n=1 Tax=Trypanosoma congolense (strain IL3000) TaxID=1068625 RepID=G0UTY9_TRYCI|nr:putative adenosine transporter [Trypanosoma congolense IL3000]
MLGFESISEFIVYVTFIFFGMSVMMVSNAIYSIPDFFGAYYKYAQGLPDVEPEDPVFWRNMFTYYNAVVFTAQVTLEAFMLTNAGRRIPIKLRLIFGLTVPLVEIAVILIIPVVHTTEAGAKATVMLVALVGGISKTLCDSSNAALVGPFPTRFYGAVVWGLAISGLITSLLSIIIKAAMDEDFDSVIKQSRIYFGIVIVIQLAACVLLSLLTTNPYAMRYAAEFRYANKKNDGTAETDGTKNCPDTEANDQDGEEKPAENANEDDAEVKNVLTNTMDPDKMKDTDQVDNITNAQQMLNASVSVVVKRIWPMLLACFFVFFATLLIFPGVFFAVDLKLMTEAELKWYHTIIVAMFNFGDFFARLFLQFKSLRPSPRFVLIGTFARILLVIPLSLSVHSIIKGVAVPWIVSFLWGLSNGYYGGMAMIYGPRTGSLTTAGQRSLAAICTNLGLLLGLFAGAMFALAVKEALPEW